MAGGQQAGEECAESEERGSCEQTACAIGACIQWARTAPRKLSKARPMTMPAAALTSAMRAAIPQDLRARPGREDAKQYREEPLAAMTFGRELRASNHTSTFHHHNRGSMKRNWVATSVVTA